eukprot:6187828-Pleurochrysis_carterae.AAC.3
MRQCGAILCMHSPLGGHHLASPARPQKSLRPSSVAVLPQMSAADVVATHTLPVLGALAIVPFSSGLELSIAKTYLLFQASLPAPLAHALSERARLRLRGHQVHTAARSVRARGRRAQGQVVRSGAVDRTVGALHARVLDLCASLARGHHGLSEPSVGARHALRQSGFASATIGSSQMRRSESPESLLPEATLAMSSMECTLYVFRRVSRRKHVPTGRRASCRPLGSTFARKTTCSTTSKERSTSPSASRSSTSSSARGRRSATPRQARRASMLPRKLRPTCKEAAARQRSTPLTAA